MMDLSQWAMEWVSIDKLMVAGRVLFMLAVGLLTAKLAATAAGRLMAGRMAPQQSMIAQRVIRYGMTVLVMVTALNELGFDLSIFVGAAGILTVAIGFASQTSASNLISGLFLMGEQPFVVGDVIRVGATTGEVISVDLLSVKLRTFDNLLVRIPNESLLRSELINVTHYPIRRVDILLRVHYKDDFLRVREVLSEVADGNTMALDEPSPIFIIQGFEECFQSIQFSVWTARHNYLPLKTELYAQIKQAFDRNNISFPYPHRIVHLQDEES